MFVQTEYLPEFGALIATRRPRSREEAPIWAAHFAVVEGEVTADTQYESDRARFIGRGRSVGVGRGHGERCAAVEYRRHRAGPDLFAAPAGADRAGQVRARRLLDPGRALARRAAAPDRQAPRPQRLRPRQDAGLDPGPGAAAPYRRQGRGSGGLPAPGGSDPVRGRRLPGFVGDDRPRRRPAVGPVAPFHFRRPADRPAAHRRDRGHRPGAPAAARPRVLAHEATGGGPGDRQRARRLLRAGPADRDRDRRSQQPVAAALRRRAGARLGVRAARRPDERPRACAAAVGGARRAAGTARPDRRPARARGGIARIRAHPAPASGCGIARACQAAAGPGVLQWPGRLRRQRTRVRDGARAGRHHAGALDQRDRQPGFRLPGVGRGQRLHLGREQPREPAHALVERSGLRSGRRSALRSRRRHRRSVDRHGAADPGPGQLHRAARPWLQPLRTPGARHRPRTGAVRAAGRPREDFAPDAAQRLRPAAPAVGHRLCGVGARHRARRLCPVHRHRDRPGHRRDAGAQRLERRIFRACRLCRPGRPADRIHCRPHRVPRPQRPTRGPGGAGRRHGVVGSHGRRPRPLRRPAARGGAGGGRKR